MIDAGFEWSLPTLHGPHSKLGRT